MNRQTGKAHAQRIKIAEQLEAGQDVGALGLQPQDLALYLIQLKFICKVKFTYKPIESTTPLKPIYKDIYDGPEIIGWTGGEKKHEGYLFIQLTENRK